MSRIDLKGFYFMRKNFAACLIVMLTVASPFELSASPLIAGRLNKPRSEDPVTVKKPNPVSKAYWSPDGYASADSVTSSIGLSMVKWSAGLGLGFAVAILAFGTSQGSGSNGHAHSDNGGGGNGGGHSHSHSH